MHCENCGTVVGTDSKFCANCGSSTLGILDRSRSPHLSTSRKRHPSKLLIAFVASIPVILLGVYLLLFESESFQIKNNLQEPSEQAERIHDGKIKAKEEAGKIKTVHEDTVTQECPSTQIAALQTLATEDGKQMVLSVTLRDGSNVKYLIKLPLPQADRLQAAVKEGVAKEKVSSWELEGMKIALSTGDNPLSLGVALKFAK